MSYDPEEAASQWQAAVEQLNDAYIEGVEEAMEGQAAFTEAWLDAIEADPAVLESDDIESYAQAYAVWLDASERLFTRLTDSVEDEEVELSELRDIWLDAANESFSEVMGTSAFAAATGETLGSALDAKGQVDEATTDLLHAYGLAAADDIEEVGARLVELERRQHAVERKLDRVLDALED
jgi:dsDNA-binding SOS-regulon protein